MSTNLNQFPRRRTTRKKTPSTRYRISARMLSITVLVLFTVALLLVSILLILANRSLPGDRLYSLKRLSERVRLSFTRSPGERLKLELLNDQNRLNEVETLIESSRVGDVEYSAQLEGTDTSGEWIVGGLILEIQPNTQIIGDINVGIHVNVHGQLSPQGEIIVERLQPRIFELEAKLNSIATNQWLVGGIPFTIMPDTLIRGAPSIGSDVRVRAELVFGDRFIAKYIERVVE